ncbi:hypothetical protein F383_12859 [Gossypium arboreum]|uniref:Uncharacterized protein n=1 Tax=Gossypium arboreum TaxID=29729 RepID=A0A0B0NCI9_GOSAR|nr:hypothetical protein F383_12859 [Gossypium arboreum]
MPCLQLRGPFRAIRVLG